MIVFSPRPTAHPTYTLSSTIAVLRFEQRRQLTAEHSFRLAHAKLRHHCCCDISSKLHLRQLRLLRSDLLVLKMHSLLVIFTREDRVCYMQTKAAALVIELDACRLLDVADLNLKAHPHCRLVEGDL